MSPGQIFMWIGISFSIIVLLILSLWIIKWHAQGTQYKNKTARIDGKVVIITGCNTGIGKEAAVELARRGGKIYMACRDVKRCEEARVDIIRKSGNSNVMNMTLDLASLESVRNFVREFLKMETKLHILINNASVVFVPRSETKERFELTLGINYLGHFLLTNLLLNTMKASMPSRIINVSSSFHKFGQIKRDDLNSHKSYNEYQSYFQSKLAMILFTRSLSKRLLASGVTVNSLHPGIVNTGKHSKWLAPILLFIKTRKSGAQTTIYLAVDPELEQVSGRYFKDCQIAKEAEHAKDDEMAEWLWNESVKLTKFNESRTLV